MVAWSFRRWNRRWQLCAQCPQVLVLRANSNTVADGGSNLLAVTAGPFLVVVGVSEDYLNVLLGHASTIAQSSFHTNQNRKSGLSISFEYSVLTHRLQAIRL